ncbi:retropepsin-like domain-containing protein [Spirulina sp. 06S082]|uniref:retropepsin-like domain-containing protein n=1 Tax=Spirulina sp. 06S082 TaxID=3110248 RepID=UPI002B20082A|nr:retropepsin-like domain-containing protein [Spirulina sp. 06S082]MEA5471233.1 retropepsin-like domain-containing protein [Spirulina sp. 06S082]
MTANISPEERDRMLQWLNRNLRDLQKYAHQYVAYNGDGVVAVNEDLDRVLEEADASGVVYSIYLVPGFTGSIVILPIYFRTVSRHEWQPNYPVSLRNQNREIDLTMLVDSGADFSVISFKIGQNLGFALADREEILVGQTLGGAVKYVLRRIDFSIDGYQFNAPVAWLQQETADIMLLGREDVFDRFNIEFRQAEEKIIFTWREKE